MEVKTPQADVGWIQGRFQVPDLHEAHKDLIKSVCDRHAKVIVSLGISPVNDNRDPLDFEARKQMINEHFPDVIVTHINDMRSDEVWSQKLDELIKTLVSPTQSVIIYGGRDSFISRYSGRHKTLELVQSHWVSGSQLRTFTKNKVLPDAAFRCGAIWNSWQKYPIVYPTVDIAVVKQSGSTFEILLARKEYEDMWRLIGGFTDTKDENYEAAARRELREEVPNIEVHPIEATNYVGSFSVDDWRYRGKRDKIKTLLYIAYYQFGDCTPADDIAEAKWFKMGDFDIEYTINKEHVELVKRVFQRLTSNQICLQPTEER